jgi:glycine cleavage system H protein
MSEMKFTEAHDWVRSEGDDVVVIGITDYAQEQLGDIVFIELPGVGTEIRQGGDAAVIESVKAASEVHAPVSGKVTEANDSLADNPVQVNEDPTGEGWFFKLKMSDPSELDDLMDEDTYKTYIAGLE